MMLTEEPIKVPNYFNRLERRLVRQDEQQVTESILLSRPPIKNQPDIIVHPNLHTRLYHGLRGYKTIEWKT